MSCHKGLSLTFYISKALNEASSAEGVLKIVSLTNIFLILITLGESIGEWKEMSKMAMMKMVY